jgi:hypothetical protein
VSPSVRLPTQLCSPSLPAAAASAHDESVVEGLRQRVVARWQTPIPAQNESNSNSRASSFQRDTNDNWRRLLAPVVDVQWDDRDVSPELLAVQRLAPPLPQRLPSPHMQPVGAAVPTLLRSVAPSDSSAASASAVGPPVHMPPASSSRGICTSSRLIRCSTSDWRRFCQTQQHALYVSNRPAVRARTLNANQQRHSSNKRSVAWRSATAQAAQVTHARPHSADRTRRPDAADLHAPRLPIAQRVCVTTVAAGFVAARDHPPPQRRPGCMDDVS